MKSSPVSRRSESDDPYQQGRDNAMRAELERAVRMAQRAEWTEAEVMAEVRALMGADRGEPCCAWCDQRFAPDTGHLAWGRAYCSRSCVLKADSELREMRGPDG